MFTKSDFIGGLSMYNAKVVLVIDGGDSAIAEETALREFNDAQLLSAIGNETNARQDADFDLQNQLAEIDNAAVADLRRELENFRADVSELRAKLDDVYRAVNKAKLEMQSACRAVQDALNEEIILRENSLIDVQERIDTNTATAKVLSTDESTVDGSFWLDLNGDEPAIKIYYGGTAYGCPLSNFNSDPVTESDIDALFG